MDDMNAGKRFRDGDEVLVPARIVRVYGEGDAKPLRGRVLVRLGKLEQVVYLDPAVIHPMPMVTRNDCGQLGEIINPTPEMVRDELAWLTEERSRLLDAAAPGKPLMIQRAPEYSEAQLEDMVDGVAPDTNAKLLMQLANPAMRDVLAESGDIDVLHWLGRALTLMPHLQKYCSTFDVERATEKRGGAA